MLNVAVLDDYQNVTKKFGNWSELEGKINLKIFPKTPPEPFWTKDKNFWQPKFNWIVNFLNGNTFGRYPGYKPNYIRLVRDRN